VVDLHRAAEALLREMRAGKLGRISLEEPPDEKHVVIEETGDATDTL
jgi:ribosome biogenesis GTPase A